MRHLPLWTLLLTSPAHAWRPPMEDVSPHPNLQRVAARMGPRLGRPEALRPTLEVITARTEAIVVVEGTAGELDVDWTDPATLEDTLLSVVNGIYTRLPQLDPDFIAILTPFTLESPIAFYLPFFNDVEGIGWQHIRGDDVFDLAPAVGLQGLLFLNGVAAYRGMGAAEARFNFLHELGHRWGTYARIDDPDTPWIHLGRECRHWSFFADSDNSALEGNRWVEAPPGVFTTTTRLSDFGYNPFDLYFMGLLPPEEVPPMSIITGVGERHCAFGAEEGIANPTWRRPVFGEREPAVQVEGIRRVITIDDVIAAEGPRAPTAAESPRRLTMLFVLLADPDVGLDPDLLAEADGLRRAWVSEFEAATATPHGGMELVTSIWDLMPQDGGLPDAGPPDASLPDVGTWDADSPDQGAPDATSTDATSSDAQPHPGAEPDGDDPSDGCEGCNTGPSPVSLTALLLGLLLYRRRRGIKKPVVRR